MKILFLKRLKYQFMFSKIIKSLTKGGATNSSSIKDSFIEKIKNGFIVQLEMLKQFGINEGHPAYEKMKLHFTEKERAIKER